jgi:hypothetical protein
MIYSSAVGRDLVNRPSRRPRRALLMPRAPRSVVTFLKVADRDKPGHEHRGRPLVDEQLADQLLGAQAPAQGVELMGPDGLLSQVTKGVLEPALAEELTGHLGYDKHDPAGRGSGNSRNSSTGKAVMTAIGAVELAVPRDRAGSFERQIGSKAQTRLEGFNERIIASLDPAVSCGGYGGRRCPYAMPSIWLRAGHRAATQLI